MAVTRDRPLVLGSGSPRRREILEGLGIPIRVVPPEGDESRSAGEGPARYLERIVSEKLGAVTSRLRGDERPRAGVLVADTIVVVDDDVLGKPTDVGDAERLLRRIVGRSHVVHTRYAVALDGALERPARTRTVTTTVTMRRASDAEIRAYAATGEGLDKAGAYAAQGVGAFLVERVEGSYTNVVGLPACEVVLDLGELGLLERFP